jgi:REP element-mobilizing transposase RayT
MARPLRIEFEGAVYHVTARGNERRKIFFSKKDYEKFKEYIAEAQKKYGFILHGYVLMTNHYQLLIETPDKNLSKIMHYINGSYTTYECDTMTPQPLQLKVSVNGGTAWDALFTCRIKRSCSTCESR